jgi:hypothetical protein
MKSDPHFQVIPLRLSALVVILNFGVNQFVIGDEAVAMTNGLANEAQNVIEPVLFDMCAYADSSVDAKEVLRRVPTSHCHWMIACYAKRRQRLGTR